MQGEPTLPSSARRAAAVLLLSLTLWSCHAPSDGPGHERGTNPPFVERGDLEAIEKRGVLRVLAPATAAEPRSGGGDPADAERALVEGFARQTGLRLFWVEVPSRDDLVPHLLAGRGDLVAASLTATPARREQVAFTIPVAFVKDQVVTRSGDSSVHEPGDLAGRRIAVRRSSPFWETLQALRQTFPEIEIQEVPAHLDTQEILRRVAERRLDITVADSSLLQDALIGRNDLRIACDLTVDRPIAWAVRPDARRLRRALNRFLSSTHLTRRRDEVRLDDLSQLGDRKPLRLLTPSSPSTYFLWRGQLMGFEYELAREFARRNGLRLEVRVPLPDEDLATLLSDGKGDILAAALPFGDEPAPSGVALSRPYNFVSQVVVAPRGAGDVRGVEDLAHRTIHAKRGSGPWRGLERLRDGGIPLVLEDLPERLDAEETIARVAEGVYELAVTDSRVLDIELTWRDDVDAAFSLGDPVPLVWAVRDSNPELLAAVNRFFGDEYRGLFYNVIYNKYFGGQALRRPPSNKSGGDLSAWDAIVRKHAEKHDLDWRLIVAQIYQESESDPDARSFAGAVGLLQVLPRTAEQFGITGLEDPAKNIDAGIRYLAWLRDRFEDDLRVRDRMWFALAAYNVGHGHVQDARKLAADQGLDPDRWFGNVERAMLLLADPEYARTARHGYCRGREPVDYVREIRTRYEAYLDALAAEPVKNPTGGPARL